VSLIELMVALVISLVLIAGAIQVYVNSRQTYEVNETLARLQETARYALSVIEPDIRMANSWGLVKGYVVVDPAIAALDNECGANFAVAETMATLDGNNNQYSFGCAAFGAGAVASADTLIVRRASLLPSAATDDRLQVCSSRTVAQVVTDSAACTPPPFGQVNDLIVNGYYINRDADLRAGQPSLRRWGLVGPTAEEMDEVEIIPGVEDMQIQFGIDPTGTTGIASRYVNPGEETAANAQVVSVRLWLLVRTETEEQGFVDDNIYEYGDRDEDANGTTADLNDAGAATRAYAPEDGFRRLLVSRTIQIRNAQGT
jgi:type IV pilus assembly protein PilW